MRDYYQLKINLPGGRVSPGTLRDLLIAARGCDVRQVRFGARQQLLMTVHYEDTRRLEQELRKLGAFFETQTDRFPNIISSYCGEGVFRSGSWLDAQAYHTVLDSFDFQPGVKINLSDAAQSFTPFFTGNLNFISSPEPHFWYLYVRPKQQNQVYRWRELVYSPEIGKLSAALEATVLAGGEWNDDLVFEQIKKNTPYVAQPVVQELELPSFSLPYYEGFNRYDARTWLGLYRRNEDFPIDFLIDVCSLCMKTRVGELCTTPWKSLVVKGIEDQHREQWSNILGKHNINVRHAASELAWQTEDHHQEGLTLKTHLIRYFEKQDMRTFGLCFGIQTRPKSEVFGSVLIKKRPLLRLGTINFFCVYDIFYTENFNPNSRTLVPFEIGLFRMHLAGQLERLCRRFSNQRSREVLEAAVAENEQQKNEAGKTPSLYECTDCLTVYDSALGDVLGGIAPGVAFGSLPPAWCCPTCDAPKSAFKLVIQPIQTILS
ncbi:rubredoxin [Dyadobacter sandarakinus]|uniref:Rubredoxin n=1 Tax=Dyadobacter sandarakinus TaxID=2747268 RepID=A0ABX7I3B9_9BACT|nr:rubredoxin [Dyadobacter sandarakinus]QRR00581.1 rubredoxin [Dyadobacter sandarakinus]